MLPKRYCLNCLNDIAFFPLQCCFEPLRKHCIGPRLHKPLTLNRIFFLYNVVWSVSDNITQGIQLCNVVPRVLSQHCAIFFLMQSCLEPLRQHCIRFLPVQCCPKNIKTTSHRIFSYTKLSALSRATLHRVFSGAMLPKEH